MNNPDEYNIEKIRQELANINKFRDQAFAQFNKVTNDISAILVQMLGADDTRLSILKEFLKKEYDRLFNSADKKAKFLETLEKAGLRRALEKECDKFIMCRKQLLKQLNTHDTKKLMIAQDSDFRNAILHSHIVADKSLIIKTLLANNKSLVTFPRRWGKSFNLNMIKAFFEIELDPLGRPLSDDLCINKKLFEIGTFNTDGQKACMKIMNEKQIVDQHFGKYLVLKLDLQNVEGRYSQLFASLSNRISHLYHNFKFLKLLVSDKKDADLIKQGIDCDEQSISEQSVEFLKTSLKSLVEILHRVYHKQVIILVDEYDYPTKSILKHISDPSERVKAVSLFKSLFSNAIKDNPVVKYAMLTGILRLGKDVSLSPLNNLQEFDMTRAEFTPHFGFTQDEVNQFFQLFSLDSNYLHRVKQMYNGYKFNTIDSVYNPWSLANCLNASYENRVEKRATVGPSTLVSYWAESGNITHFVPLFFNPSVLHKFDELLSQSDSTTFTIIDSLCEQHMRILQDLLSKSQSSDFKQLSEVQIDILFTYLCYMGYFSIECIDGKKITVRLPNLEVKSEISKLISLAVNQSRYSIRALTRARNDVE